MNINDLKLPINSINYFGLKFLIYGRAGSGKTRSVLTCPEPLLLSTEPNGLLSIKDSNVPVYDINNIGGKDDITILKNKIEAIEDFVKKISNPEFAKFQTVFVDSLSEINSLILRYYMKTEKNGQRAYGLAADRTLEIIRGFYCLRKHVVMVCKLNHIVVDEVEIEIGKSNKLKYDNGITQFQPSFEGKKVGYETEHLFDEILFFNRKKLRNINGQFEEYDVCTTKGTMRYVARDRSGKLAEDEPQDFNYIINKILN